MKFKSFTIKFVPTPTVKSGNSVKKTYKVFTLRQVKTSAQPEILRQIPKTAGLSIN